MNLLLDTHALWWWYYQPGALSRTALAVIEDYDNRLFISSISLLEISLKVRKGKLKSEVPLEELVHDLENRDRVVMLPLKNSHILGLSSLLNPLPHRDPFDHLLLVQAQIERLVFVSKDRKAEQYPTLTILW